MKDSPETLMTVDAVAAYLGVPKATCYSWRYRGVGPPAVRVGRYLRYRQASVEQWLSEQEQKRRRSA